jgi:hypothetical protein
LYSSQETHRSWSVDAGVFIVSDIPCFSYAANG